MANNNNLRFDPMTGRPIEPQIEAQNEQASESSFSEQANAQTDTENTYSQGYNQTYGSDYTSQYNQGFANAQYGQAYQNQQFVPKEKKKKEKKNSGGKVVAIAICCSLIAGGLGAGGTFAGLKYYGYLDSDSASSSSNNSSTTIYTSSRTADVVEASTSTSDEEMTASEVYQNNVRSTVGITTSITTNYFGYQTTAAASGSGFIISADGYILTNYHVIEDASEITVTDYDGNQYTAELVGAYSNNDIAVLKIDTENELTPVVLGDSDNLNVGDGVVAIGNPSGELTFSLTSGVVSALDREVTTDYGTMALIQTDCAINSGNSGGALFNMYGEVVGITNAKYSSSSSTEASIDNIGFAIPINQVKSMVESIIENGYIEKAYVGLSVTDVPDDLVSYGTPEGAYVMAITEDSPAEDAGIQEYDIITAIDGTEITTSNELVTYVGSCSEGDEIELSVYRSNEYITVTVTVGVTQVDTTDITSDDETTTDDYSDFYGYDYGYGYGY